MICGYNHTGSALPGVPHTGNEIGRIKLSGVNICKLIQLRYFSARTYDPVGVFDLPTDIFDSKSRTTFGLVRWAKEKRNARVIDRQNRACLVLGLKWFIEPAEIREINEWTKNFCEWRSASKNYQRIAR
jgi:hypothetical protein